MKNDLPQRGQSEFIIKRVGTENNGIDREATIIKTIRLNPEIIHIANISRYILKATKNMVRLFLILGSCSWILSCNEYSIMLLYSSFEEPITTIIFGGL